jgi:ABC-type sugar transport system ATPase subunit
MSLTETDGNLGVEASDIRKSFGANDVLKGVSLRVRPGEVLGLIGANGAGKSTLVKIASGQIQPDGGHISVDGDARVFKHPRQALRAGITLVPQELNVLPGLPVADAIVLGDEPGRRTPFYTHGTRYRAAGRVLDELELDIDPGLAVDELEPAQQRLVALAVALHQRAKVIYMDEPTAAMGQEDAELVLRTIKTLASQGVAIVFVTHRFNELLKVCTHIQALRDGRVSWVRPRGEVDVADLVQAVAGEALEAKNLSHREFSNPMLTATDVVGDRVNGVSLTIHEGEVLGLTGLVGCGASEFLEILGGAKPKLGGEIVVGGRPHRGKSPFAAQKSGIGFLPAERSRSGFLDSTLLSNVAVSSIGRIARLGLISKRLERRVVAPLLKRRGLDARLEDPLWSLSGGNRQKVLLTRIECFGAKVLVLVDPTAGVDVGARANIQLELRNMAAHGHAVVVSASEPEELLGFADRIVVMSSGEVSREFAGSDVSASDLIYATTT